MVCSIQMKIEPDVKEDLEKLKIHPRQSYSEVIKILIKEYNLKQDGME